MFEIISVFFMAVSSSWCSVHRWIYCHVPEEERFSQVTHLFRLLSPLSNEDMIQPDTCSSLQIRRTNSHFFSFHIKVSDIGLHDCLSFCRKDPRCEAVGLQVHIGSPEFNKYQGSCFLLERIPEKDRKTGPNDNLYVLFEVVLTHSCL